MTITKRRLLVVASSLAAMSPNKGAMAQRSAVPNPQEVRTVLREGRDAYPLLLEGMDALTHILALRVIQLKLEQSTLDAWFAVRRSLLTSTSSQDVIDYAATNEAEQLIAKAGDAAKPTAVRIEAALESGDLPPNGEIGKQMLRSFYLFIQIKAVAERKVATRAWYCEVYPFSRFCAT